MPRKTDITTEIHKAVAENILRFRFRKGISGKTLGKAVGVSLQQLSKYETGANRITIGRLVLLAEAVGQPIEAFYKNTNRPIVKKTQHQEICEEIINIFRKIHDIDITNIAGNEEYVNLLLKASDLIKDSIKGSVLHFDNITKKENQK
jgi:transcriptional regulator with XRE-family HTH domain